MERPWPFVGRERELARVAAALGRADAAGLLLAGPAGVGKTRLATECAAIAERVGFRCARVLATRAAADVPLGALAPLLPADSRRSGPRGNWLRAAADAIASGPGPLLLVVDDAHLLDNASATVVQQLAAPDRAFVVLTTRAGLPVPEPLLALWKDAIVERLDLAPLTVRDVDRILDTVLGGAIDGAARLELFQASQGNALFLHELVLGALDTDILRREQGVWRLTRRLATSPRLVELVQARLVDLDRTERELLELVALGEPLPWEIVAQFASPETVESLERHELVQTVQQRSGLQVGLAHPLYGEVLRGQLTALGRMAASRRLAEAAAGVGVERVGALPLAVWQLDGGGDIDPAIMVDAARGARRAGNLPLAERLAVAAVDAGAGPAAGLLHARVLGERGWHDRAQALLAELSEQAGTEQERVAVAIERSRALLYWLGRGAEAAETLETIAKSLNGALLDRVTAHRALVALMRGHLSDALSAAEVVGAAAPGQGLATGAATAAVAAALSGQAGMAMEYVRRAERGSEPGRARLAQVVALIEAGRLAEADTAATALYDRSLRLHSRTGQAWVAMLRGRLELLTGQLGRAEHAFAEGMAIGAQIGQLALRRWCAAGIALAAAQRGDGVRAAAAVAELNALPGTDLHLLQSDELRARAWTAQLGGNPVRAKDLLREGAEVAQQAGAVALAASAWHNLARLGALDAAAPLLELAAGTDNPLVAARADTVAAMIGHDPDGLAAASERFEAMGALLLAAESSAAAAAEYRRRQDARAAERMADRAHALSDRCDRAHTPGLDLAGPVAELTSREREIATLAARGNSNREIADALTVSVRTVETHLQRAYTKLGVTSRTGLAAVLRSRPRKAT
ncbi:MAG TPA: LuxR C-terminal-related transcriptional regulator [Actinophytocola sp.]|uniref:LuxR C-terminal-related transcriptional regulator n=1 Tax=Actinophytocola sp. TaxID=1872138 RepID=UPI002DDD6153|nr:LuxR C-terminal-related transcriptional regulator [Actinophytocola sp.]HEV2783431.1 LuxR C-terminal-related transcriptional regulator [Actinophytocola sp.]